jgi:hypothetical protein
VLLPVVLLSCKQNPAACDCCSHVRMSHHCWWNRHVANPIKYHGYQGELVKLWSNIGQTLVKQWSRLVLTLRCIVAPAC